MGVIPTSSVVTVCSSHSRKRCPQPVSAPIERRRSQLDRWLFDLRARTDIATPKP